jgi:uncharacterized membrane protein
MVVIWAIFSSISLFFIIILLYILKIHVFSIKVVEVYRTTILRFDSFQMDALSVHKFALSFSLDQSFEASLSKPPNLIRKAAAFK